MRYIFLILLSLGIGAFHPAIVQAQTNYTITTEQSKIQGSIRYSLIGKYVAHFEKFSGQMQFDPQAANNSVELIIQTKSIKSKFPTLDHIVISRRLLYANKFPTITFKSTKIEHVKDNEYKVKGKATLHGVTRELEFPFSILERGTNQNGQRYLKAKGKWVIARKQFDVIWHSILDKGGFVVGDHVTLDWEITALAPKAVSTP